MALSRRSLLMAATGGPLAFAQASNSVAVGIPSGLRMERFGDPQLPAVALFLPATKSPSVIIEMPEHAWRKEKRRWRAIVVLQDVYLRPGPTRRGQVGERRQHALLLDENPIRIHFELESELGSERRHDHSRSHQQLPISRHGSSSDYLREALSTLFRRLSRTHVHTPSRRPGVDRFGYAGPFREKR